ncbi:MAG: KOW domain-containing RNA-binding protein [Syntrophomonadaceae bacterium]
MLGRVVISKSGRDLGKPFVVVRVINERYLSLSDGDLRKIENPKKKNVRHLKVTAVQAEEVLECLNQGEVLTNQIIKKNLKQLFEKGLIHGEGGLRSG